MVTSVELEIVKRLIKPEAGNLSPDVARFFLSVQLDSADQARMAELNFKANRGSLDSDEERELDAFIRVSDSLAILHAKARISLKAQSSAA
jgi:hypothetical protein